MKRFAISLLALTATLLSTVAGEIVSKRIVDAINDGKFYMKITGIMNVEDEGDKMTLAPILDVAVKDGVTMTRSSDMGMLSLVANGHTYTLDEKNKTYTVYKLDDKEPRFDNIGRLTFKNQGECQLNGVKYYYDRYRSSKGHSMTFYYNSQKVAVIDFGMESSGLGKMSLLSFDAKIPETMFFCLSKEWKNASLGASATPDASKYISEETLKNADLSGLPEGMDIKALISGKVDEKALIRQYVKEEDLPEGMSMSELMGMVDQSNNAHSTQNYATTMTETRSEMKKMLMEYQGYTEAQAEHYLEASGLSKSNISDAQTAFNEQEAHKQMVQNAPEPPRCSTPWIDSSQGCELAAGGNLGVINITDEQTLSTPVYIDQFDKVENLQASLSLEVSDEGIWNAFNAFVEETKNMTQDEAVTYVMQYNEMAFTAAEIGCVTGALIERAVASCMLCPSAVTYNNTGILFAYKSDMENALKFYEAAEKMAPDNPTVQVNLAEYYFEKGNYVASRRHANKAIAAAPDYGLAYQILTSINLAEGKSVEAAKTLFKSAATYFSDITAQQFFSLKMAMLSSQVQICDGFDYEKLFNEIFSPENLELLTKATKAGFEKEVAVPADKQKFDWLLKSHGDLHTTYMSLGKRQEESRAYRDSLMSRNDQLITEHPYIAAIVAMGTRNANKDFQAAEDLINTATDGKIPGGFDMPDMPSIDTYAVASQMARGSADGCYLLDARQYWCIDLWRFYYNELIRMQNGGWSCHRTDPPTGTWPEVLTTMENNKEKYLKYMHDEELKLGKSYQPCIEAYDKCLESADNEVEEFYCKVQYYRCILPLNKAFVRNAYTNYESMQLDDEKMFYTQYIQPILEEYWAKITEMVGYCENQYLKEYILNEVTDDIQFDWHKHIGIAHDAGKNIEQQWTIRVQKLEKEIKQTMSIISQLDMPKIPAIRKSGGTLKNYGEKPKPDFRVSIPLPWGSIGFQRRNEQYSIVTENEATGKTKIRNLTTGEKTEYSSYESLADKPHSQDPKGYGKCIAEWLGKKMVGDMIDKVVKVPGPFKASNFKPVNESKSSRQRMRVIDPEGNVTSTGIVYNASQTVGADAINMTRGQTQIRTGNYRHTERHTTLNFKFFNVTTFH